jgi:hypothetical protein
MVLNTNHNNYKLDSPSNNKDLYNNSGSNNYHHYNNQYLQQQPSMNYNNWYVADSSTQHNVSQYEETQSINKAEDSPVCCNCFLFQPCEGSDSCCNDSRDLAVPSYNIDNNRSSASNVIASYGVYGSAAVSEDDDDDGFVSRSGGGYRYHHSVVNVTGNATSTNILRETPTDDRTCVSSWCAIRGSRCSGQQDNSDAPGSAVPTTSEATCCSNWCRPTILLLLLVLLVVVFVFISGILLYFNCTYLTRFMHDL